MRKRRSSVFLKTPIGFSLPTAISTVHIGVKGQCPKDVQVWSARDTQVILYLYQSQGDYQTVHTQETTGTNGGEATSTFNNTKQTQSAGSSAISSVHPLDQLSDEGDKVCDYECSVTFNRSAGGVGGEVSPESASGGSKRKRTTRVVVSPEDVLPSVALAQRANLLVM